MIVMRTACLVIALTLLTVSSSITAQERAPASGNGDLGSDVDREITVRGEDETALPVPAPASRYEIALPQIDIERPDVPSLPPILPPGGAGAAPFPDWRVRDPAGASPS